MITPASIPLALYVHLPWCAQKCPYCDFNSHEGFSPSLQQPYVDALLSDLDSQLNWLSGRPIGSIFIGGGTPSLFDGESIAQLLAGIGDRLTLSGDAEITLESNPNSADVLHFKRYRLAGVNRLSIGVQTFHDQALQCLGRLHSGDEARHALDHIRGAGFDRWNIDLMHGLPGRSVTVAEADVAEAIERSAGHVSWYQLTIERNTRFWSAPPTLPSEDELACIQLRGEELFQKAGFLQYETAHQYQSKPVNPCLLMHPYHEAHEQDCLLHSPRFFPAQEYPGVFLPASSLHQLYQYRDGAFSPIQDYFRFHLPLSVRRIP